MADLVDISGIGPAAKTLLIKHGFTTVKKVAAATVAELGVVPGFGEARSRNVIDAANTLLGGDVTAAPGKQKAKKQDQKKDKKAGKKKDKKKDRKKDKKKDKKKGKKKDKKKPK